MSLFKARDWWHTVVGSDEEFDVGCLCVANVDNSGTGFDKIVVGSFHGFLRIYKPQPSKTENGWTGFQPEDVVCEMQLSHPVLQVNYCCHMQLFQPVCTVNLHLSLCHKLTQCL